MILPTDHLGERLGHFELDKELMDSLENDSSPVFEVHLNARLGRSFLHVQDLLGVLYLDLDHSYGPRTH